LAYKNISQFLSCLTCRASFKPKTYHQQFCSRLCREVGRGVNHFKENRKCKECNSEFKTNRNFQIYCSSKCSHSVACRNYRNGSKRNSYLDMRLESQRKHDKKFPEKVKARIALRLAVERGEIFKPDYCSECFKNCKPHGHHEDYSKSLDVIWLCSKCHGLRHGRNVQVH